MSEATIAIIGVVVGAIVALYVSHREQRSALRMAALEKRLSVHQDAHRIWAHLLSRLYDPILRQAAYRQCMHWWDENCLYLEAKTRKEFYTVLRAVPTFNPGPNQSQSDLEIFRRAENMLDQISAGVYLPPIGDTPNKRNEAPKGVMGTFNTESILNEVNSQFDEYGIPIK